MRPFPLLAATTTFLAVPALAHSQQWSGWIRGGHSVVFLGSEDHRTGFGVAVQWEQPWGRLRYRSHSASLVLEGSFDRTYSAGEGRSPADTTNYWNLLAVGRYYGGWRGKARGFVELGWGASYGERRTEDLDVRLNSTPVIGGGYEHRDGTLAALRFLHISNAGFGKRNQGQNQLWLMLGRRF